ncbi:OmpA family protein [Marinospirillum sp.]|uniref:MotY family protein n=1 Tax=Marinospirillum sp. TaxID=2183934 RepID=UPI003A84DEAC
MLNLLFSSPHSQAMRRGLAGVLGLSLCWSASAMATTWQAGYTPGAWEATAPSALNCELIHVIPDFGVGRFIHRAGESVRFEVQPFRHAMQPGPVHLVALAPAWQPGLGTQHLGEYHLETTDQPVRIGTPETERMLASLRQGLMPSLLQEDNDPQIERRRASMTPIAFHQAYSSFQQCQAQLLPVNFDQIREVMIHFRTGGAVLTQADKDQLDLIVRYVYADPQVVGISVDGHSDTTGTRRLNRQLSFERAEAVRAYLVARGLPERLLTVQYHGQRFPMADNRTAEGRSLNRRVHIQLEPELEIQPLF